MLKKIKIHKFMPIMVIIARVTLNMVEESVFGPRAEKEATKGVAALRTIIDLCMTARGALKVLSMKKKIVKKVKISIRK